MSATDEHSVLVVAKDADDAVLAECSEAADEISTRTVETTATAVSVLQTASDEATRPNDAVDCVVLDCARPDSEVTKDVDRLQRERPAVPILLVDAPDSAVSAALDAGATDVVYRDRESWPELLAHRILNSVELAQSTSHPGDDTDALNALLERSSDRLSVLDRDGTYKFVSPAVEHLMGYEQSELLGTSGFEYVHPDDRERVRETFERIRTSPDEIHSVEYRLRDANDEWRWVESRGTNRFDDPAIEGMVVNSREITDRKVREQQLEQYETVAEAVDDIVYAVDAEGRFQFVNDSQESMTGYSREELLGEHISILMPDDSRKRARERIRELRETESRSTTFERTAVTADGETLYCEDHMSLLPSDDDEFRGTAGIIRNITQRKEREKQLEAERKRFRTLFERLPEPTVEFEFQNGSPVVKQVNPAFERTFGYEADELIGEPIDEYVVPEAHNEEAGKLNERVKSGEQFLSEEITRQTTDGLRHFLFQTAVYNEGTEGFAVYADITEQKERQQQLREEKALSDTILETLPDVFYLFDEQGNFVRWNDRANEVSGYSDEEIAEMHPSQFVVEADRPKVFEGIAEVIEDDATIKFEARARTKDGEAIPYEYTGAKLTDETGQILGIVGLGRDISEQKERERELERKNDLFRKTQEIADIGAWEFDVTTGEVWSTDQLKRIFGRSPDESLEMEGAIDYFVPEDRPKLRDALDRAADDGEAYELELRLVDENENERWVRASGEPQFDDGAVVRIRGTLQDITEQKAWEENLREERALTETIFDALPDVFYAFDTDINFLRWNDRLRDVTGYSDEEIAEMHPAQFVAAEDREEIFEGIAEVIENGDTVTVEARFETKDGEQIPYEFTGAEMRDETGELLGLVGIGRDISERKERQRRFEAVFNNTYQFTGLMQPDGTVVEVNDTALQFGGLDREDVVGEPLWEAYWFQNDATARKVAKGAVEQAQNGSLYRDELEVQGAEGTEIIDFSVRPIVDEQGEVRLLIPEGRTITDLKERERHLKLLNRFLRHNLRNKMTVIKGRADVLCENLDDMEYVDHLERLTETASELIELGETAHELLQITVEAEPDLQPTDPDDVLSEVISQFRTEHPAASITMSVETDKAVVADHRLEAVFEQLVENAIVHVETETPSVEITVTETGDTISIRIVDNGPGIPGDELSGIITDEEQTQLTHGTGFGLWLARSVVDDYNGNLDYETAADGGSVLIVELQPVTEYSSGSERSSGTGVS